MRCSFALSRAIGFGIKARSYAKQLQLAFAFGRRRQCRLWRWSGEVASSARAHDFTLPIPFRRNNWSGRRHQCRTVDINECAAGIQGTLAADTPKTRQVAVSILEATNRRDKRPRQHV